MVVQHNLSAMNTNRMLGITMGVLAKSSEKLASGYKVNRAADDAAGLSISEKMRKQIRGLSQASLNAQDGISSVQTAEGALAEVHDMLQRMNELAVKAANGTNSEDDRQAIQDEVEQLLSEVDRVAETTKFNEIYMLKGDPKQGNKQTVMLNAHDAGLDGFWIDKFGEPSVHTANDTNIAATTYVINLEVGSVITIGGRTYEIDEASGADDAQHLSSGKITSRYADELIVAELEKANRIGDTLRTSGVHSYYTGTPGTVSYLIKKASTEVQKDLTFSLHVGADSDMSNKINVRISRMDTMGLGIDGLNVKDDFGAEATYAIDAIADAISRVSAQRSALGAIQNRLEHTIRNLDNIVENTTAAESQIRDTDMATEMVRYSNTSILAQAGQAMLAQANQANQGVLSLLG